MRYTIIFFYVLINSVNIFAEPSPFGLEIYKSTYKNIKNKYPGFDKGVNLYSNGKMYSINCNNIDIKGIKSILTIFNTNDLLVGVIVKFQRYRYADLLSSLKEKYNLIENHSPFVGNKYAKFMSGETIVTIDSEHMSFDLEVSYIHNELEKMFITQSKKQEEQRKRNEVNSL